MLVTATAIERKSRQFLRTGRSGATRTPPALTRIRKKNADRFTVHGHRLSSLYRALNFSAIPFIVLKILKKLRAWLAVRIEYLWNNETAGAVR